MLILMLILQLAAVNNPTNAAFKITDTKSYALVVTLSTKDDNELLEEFKTRSKKTIRWNKCSSEMCKLTKTV